MCESCEGNWNVMTSARVERLLSDYVQPEIDPGIDEGLKEYVAKKKESEPDAFG